MPRSIDRETKEEKRISSIPPTQKNVLGTMPLPESVRPPESQSARTQFCEKYRKEATIIPPPPQEALPDSFVGSIRDQLKSSGIMLESGPVSSRLHHISIVPESYHPVHEEPAEGFSNVLSYITFCLSNNKDFAAGRKLYNSNPVEHSFNDIEIPGKKQSRVLVECADGRNSPVLFIDKKDLTKHYSIDWLPFAGLIIFPEIDSTLTQEKLEQLFKENPELLAKVYARMDLVFGQEVEDFLLKKAEHSEFEKLDFEFQAHFDGQHFPHHGCGAHCSDFNNAQIETIKNCFLTQKWLQAKYTKEYARGDFRVYRTAHDTSKGGNVLSGAYADQTRVNPEFFQKNQQLFEEAAQLFEAPRKANNPEGVIIPYVANHTEINEEHHDEQVIRISQSHFAYTLVGQSVLEISWTDNAENIFAHLKVLLGIIEKNFRAKPENQDKPAIIHFDLPISNSAIENTYIEVLQLIEKDAYLQSRENAGTLQIVATKTNIHTYESQSDEN